MLGKLQYARRLFRHLKTAIDTNRRQNGRFILTASQ